MNEQMQNLLDTVRRTAGQAGDVAAGVAYGAGKKAGELLSVAKLRVKIAETEGSVKEKLQELGGLLYATHIGTPTDSDVLLEKLQEIDDLKARLREMRARAGQERVCPTCGASLRDGDSYCRECGEKL